MSYSVKRKSTLSSLVKEVSPPKRWQNVQKVTNTTHASGAPPPVPMPQPFIDRVSRPKRWRKHKYRTETEQAVQQPINDTGSSSSDDVKPKYHLFAQEKQDNIEIRFSFASSPDEAKPVAGKETFQNSPPIGRIADKALNQSFTNLSFEQDKPARTSRPRPNTSATQVNLPVIPDLTKPKRKKEGYGFSFSDSMFYDSDEYPDTECDWDSGTEKDSGRQIEPPPTSNYTALVPITQDSSFSDIVVMRDVGSFHMAKPQKRLTCTTATREDTIRAKHTAKSLFKYAESTEVYAQLVSRLERMVYNSMQGSFGSGLMATTSTTQCALKLQDFLLLTKAGRIETGEHERLVEHEIEWATWLVEASRTGVMHLKSMGCRCRPDWEE
ncbi:hypothetical protein BDU57DRAFT_275736 [Ampelomyces quisqualis]|uniref:Uncharacterized protein n=1 Tax=Ampelomyces quisqualis TaxID=50730 RepID=A0A6A5QM02_AMPQU|nr:hypothetical protein BDU57DRAFT_275736 [Ampelomyces quisqualis]